MRHFALLAAGTALLHCSPLLCSMSDGFDASGGGIDPDKPVTIKVPKDNPKSDSVIRGSVNGQSYAVAVDQEVEVPGAVAMAIADSGVTFEVVDGEGAGLPEPSTAPLTDTATRLEPNVDPLEKDKDGEQKPVPTLKGGDGDTGVGAGSADPAAVSREEREGAANAEGQGIASAAGPSDATTDAARAEAGDRDDGDEKADDAPQGDSVKDASSKETVDELTKRIAQINDVDQLHEEHEREEQGAKRTTALAAIDARIDAISKA